MGFQGHKFPHVWNAVSPHRQAILQTSAECLTIQLVLAQST